MEPPPFGDGNGPAEQPLGGVYDASMEPPPFGDGNKDGLRSARMLFDASMEPPPFGDGNRDRRGRAKPRMGDASMEPPPFGDGNSIELPTTDYELALQWSHRLSAMETPLDGQPARAARDRFNGATAFRRWKLASGCIGQTAVTTLQWSHRLSAMETHETVAAKVQDPPASMEPPPFGDGNWSLRTWTTWTCACFNGATAFRRWKLKHGVPAVDSHGGASMEPPPFGDGNALGLTPHPRPVCSYEQLCMGRHMETPLASRPIPGLIASFNGATAFRRWKRYGIRRITAIRSRFNGATAFRRWKPAGAQGTDPVHGASMEPPPFGDGNFAGTFAVVAQGTASMEPPPFGDGNSSIGYLWPPATTCFNGATAFRRWKPPSMALNTPAM